MKNITLLLSVLLLFTVTLSAQKLTKLWETDTVLSVPESVLYSDSVLYVSCINGKSNQKNEAGFIAKLSLKGEIIKKDWATGINAPKGMGIYEGYLFVSDIDRVLVIDINTGKIVNKYEFKDAVFLNDIAISESGRVYISDTRKNTIYIIHEEFSKKLITDGKLNSVNGLYCEGEKLYAGTSNGVFILNKKGDIESHFIKNTGGIDGLEKVREGVFLNSDWVGKVQLISKNAEPKVLLNFEAEDYNAADIGFDKTNKVVYIPTFFGNTVAAYKLKE